MSGNTLRVLERAKTISPTEKQLALRFGVEKMLGALMVRVRLPSVLQSRASRANKVAGFSWSQVPSNNAIHTLVARVLLSTQKACELESIVYRVVDRKRLVAARVCYVRGVPLFEI